MPASRRPPRRGRRCDQGRTRSGEQHMDLNLRICAVREVIPLIELHAERHALFDMVVSFENVFGALAVYGRAPRLHRRLGKEWKRKQIILRCFDAGPGSRFAPGPQIVERALDRFEQLSPASVLLHCVKGRSRSAALGLTFLRYVRGPGSEIECMAELLRVRPQAQPNKAIVEHADRILGCNGRLIEAADRQRAAKNPGLGR
jgi:hypothetical protein